MGTDKRTVTTDALETLGTIIGPDEKRDAIHLAVYPAVAAQDLKRAQHVGLLPDGRAAAQDVEYLGIVDPFLETHVKRGQCFWLVVYPRKITSLRHVWEHPDFAGTEATEEAVLTPVDPAKEESREWVEDFIAGINSGASFYADEYGGDDLTYDQLMTAADNFQRDGSYLSLGPLLEGHYVNEEFWSHYAILRGVARVRNTGSFFSCSC